MRRYIPIVVAILVAVALVAHAAQKPPAKPAAPTSEPARLEQIATACNQAAEGAATENQKRCYHNAAAACGAAADAAAAGNEDEAKKQKRNALKWVAWAAKECADPGELPGQIGESLQAEGGMSQDGLDRLNNLMETLKKAKKAKEKSGFPINQELALKEIMKAILSVIEHGTELDTSKALWWYLEATTFCDDVQDLINDLLDHIENRGSISKAARDQAKTMVQNLYKMKAAGAGFIEISDKADEIKKFIQDEFGRVSRAWLRGETDKEKKEEPPPKEDKAVTSDKSVAPAVTSVTFTALQGKTEVNKQFIGDIQQVKFVAVDGTEVPPTEVEPDLSVHDDSYTLTVGDGTKIAGIVLQGTEGVVRLLQDGTGGAPAGFAGIAPRDGVIDVRNGAINETFNIVDPTLSGPSLSTVRDHSLSVDGTATRIVATRPNQVAVVAAGIEPTTGTSRVELMSSSVTGIAAAIARDIPSWGYNISLPPTTKTETWVPITAEVFGLEPMDVVRFEFLAAAGQQITPQVVTVMAAEAIGPTPVAKLATDTPGPQALNVIVTREGGP